MTTETDMQPSNTESTQENMEKKSTQINATKLNHLDEKKVSYPTKPIQVMIPTEPPEKLSEIEKAIISLSEELANLTELREAIEESFDNKAKDDTAFKEVITSYFNTLKDSFIEFSGRLDKEINFRAELEAKIQNAENERRVFMLQTELNEERAKIAMTLDNLAASVKNTLSEISSSVNSAANAVEEKCTELRSAERQIDDAIKKFRGDSIAATSNEYKELKIQCEELFKKFISSAQETLETVKKQSIDFLSQCEKENKNLISKVPSVNDKSKSIVNWIVIAFGVLGLASFLASLFVR